MANFDGFGESNKLRDLEAQLDLVGVGGEVGSARGVELHVKVDALHRRRCHCSVEVLLVILDPNNLRDLLEEGHVKWLRCTLLGSRVELDELVLGVGDAEHIVGRGSIRARVVIEPEGEDTVDCRQRSCRLDVDIDLDCIDSVNRVESLVGVPGIGLGSRGPGQGRIRPPAVVDHQLLVRISHRRP